MQWRAYLAEIVREKLEQLRIVYGLEESEQWTFLLQRQIK